MADIFVSYTRADQEIVRKIVGLLEAQGWSVWWDTRIGGGDRWDATIEREIKAARCVLVVWTPRSADREWVREEAEHGRKRGVLVPILLDLDEPPFGFGRIQARNLTGWDGAMQTPGVSGVLEDVRLKLVVGTTSLSEPKAPNPTTAELARDLAGMLARSVGSERTEGRIKIDAPVIYGAPDGWFAPGNGKTEWFKDIDDIDIGPEMVVVPAGGFIMGSNGRDFEEPPHSVTITKPFAVGRFPVTFAEWDDAGLLHRPSDEGWGRDLRPVINVSWDDAKSYAAWLSQKTGKNYRLLSEAEWEYCCRAGTTTKYAFGDSITREQAQFSPEPLPKRKPLGTPLCTAEVGTFPPNAWGLYDMHGNVWEWCEDNWHADYNGAPRDGSVWAGGDVSERVLRGGAWNNSGPDNIHSAFRLRGQPSERKYNVGFRLARML